MKLFVLRHGRAENRAASDFDRALTDSGRADLTRVLTGSREALAGVDQVWVSPLLRAQQSAAIAVQVLGGSPPMETTEALVPEADLNKLYRRLQGFTGEALLLVSHQPLVGELVNDLCGAEPGLHPMGTASLAALELELVASGLAELLWLRHPVS